ncbi:MAG: hypothetical protein NVSMB48_14340 [Marmoricola sp.]
MSRCAFAPQRTADGDCEDLDESIDHRRDQWHPAGASDGVADRDAVVDAGSGAAAEDPPRHAGDKSTERQREHAAGVRGLLDADQKGVLGVAEGEVLDAMERPGQGDPDEAGRDAGRCCG